MITTLSQHQRADALHRLHQRGSPLVLVNAWDAASAGVLQASGASAIATTSAGMAWSLGYADGEQMPRDDFIAACARICRIARVPVTVDIERGFGRDAADVCELVRVLIRLGVVGVNIEDGVSPTTKQLLPPEPLCERIAALRALTAREDARVFINARTDVYFATPAGAVDRFESALRRAQLYASAGADGIFVPGMYDIDDVARFASSIELPLNIYAGHPGVPDVQSLGRAGVQRVSLGCGPLQAVLKHIERIARGAFTSGRMDLMTKHMADTGELNSLFLPLTP